MKTYIVKWNKQYNKATKIPTNKDKHRGRNNMKKIRLKSKSLLDVVLTSSDAPTYTHTIPKSLGVFQNKTFQH